MCIRDSPCKVVVDTFIIRVNRKEVPDMMSMLKKIVLFPISLFVAFLALMAKWLLTLSSYVVAPLMLYIFGCGIYTVYRQTWNQFFILLVAEFICFIQMCIRDSYWVTRTLRLAVAQPA